MQAASTWVELLRVLWGRERSASGRAAEAGPPAVFPPELRTAGSSAQSFCRTGCGEFVVRVLPECVACGFRMELPGRAPLSASDQYGGRRPAPWCLPPLVYSWPSARLCRPPKRPATHLRPADGHDFRRRSYTQRSGSGPRRLPWTRSDKPRDDVAKRDATLDSMCFLGDNQPQSPENKYTLLVCVAMTSG